MAKREGGAAGGLNSEQLSNARVIISVGRQLGMSQRDIQIALMAAMVESRLRNLNYGDRDSIGLFQQRNAWGSREARLDPYQSARMFFLGGAQGQRGLKDFSNRNNMSMGRAAQAVQVSAFPGRYAEYEYLAGGIIAREGAEADLLPNPERPISSGPLQPNPFMPMGQSIDSGIGEDMMSAYDKLLDDGIGANDKSNLQFGNEPLGIQAADEPIDYSQYASQDVLMPDLPDDAKAAMKATFPGFENVGNGGAQGMRSAVINMAQRYVGKVKYKWGEEDPSVGFDCSGLIQYVFNQMGIKMPRLGHEQAQRGQQTSISKIRAGDLVYWRGQHIAIYLGNGQILEAPRPGLSVRIRNLGEWSADDDAIGIKLDY